MLNSRSSSMVALSGGVMRGEVIVSELERGRYGWGIGVLYLCVTNRISSEASDLPDRW